MKARVNNKYDFVLDKETPFRDGAIDMIEVRQGTFHIIKDNKSYTAKVLKTNYEEKYFVIRVNGNSYRVQIKDKYDDLLSELGMEMAQGATKVKEIKSPMPGLVVDVRVKEGDAVKKGDALVVLQAMKMENILKCPVDTTVKKIYVRKDDAIEKNQILISFS